MIAGSAVVAAAGGAVLAAKPAERVYVPLGGNGEIAVVDVATDTVGARIPGLTAVHGLAATPDGRFLIAGSYEARKAGAPAPDRPSGVPEDEHEAHHRAPPPGAADGELSTVSIIDRKSAEVVRRIDVPGAVHHVAVSPDGRFAVATHPQGGGITAIDLGSSLVVANLATGPLPNYAVFSPDSRILYVSNAGNDTISAIDTGRWIVKWNLVAGSSPEHIVLASDGSRLFVNNVDGGTVSVIDTGAQKVERTIAVGDTLHGVDLSDDGRTLFVAALGDNKLAAIDLVTGVYKSVRLAPAPYHLATIRGTGKIYVSSSEELKMWVVEADNLRVIGEIAIGGKGHQMVQ